MQKDSTTSIKRHTFSGGFDMDDFNPLRLTWRAPLQNTHRKSFRSWKAKIESRDLKIEKLRKKLSDLVTIQISDMNEFENVHGSGSLHMIPPLSAPKHN